MGGFNVAEEEKGVNRGENGDSRACIQVHAQHRRSKRWPFYLLIC